MRGGSYPRKGRGSYPPVFLKDLLFMFLTVLDLRRGSPSLVAAGGTTLVVHELLDVLASLVRARGL